MDDQVGPDPRHVDVVHAALEVGAGGQDPRVQLRMMAREVDREPREVPLGHHEDPAPIGPGHVVEERPGRPRNDELRPLVPLEAAEVAAEVAIRVELLGEREVGALDGARVGIAVDEMTYGLDMREALQNMGRRIEVQDFQYVVVAINIQHETGGNLAEVLRNLSTVIRDRFRMFKKIKALSSEGRLSAIVLSFLPFAVGALIFTGNPGFYLDVADDPLFLPMMGAALGLMLAGIYVMYRMVNFRV